MSGKLLDRPMSSNRCGWGQPRSDRAATSAFGVMVPRHVIRHEPVARLRVRPVAFGERPRQARRLKAALQGQDGFDGGRNVIAHRARNVAAGFACIVRVVVAKFRAQLPTLAQQGVRLRFVAASGQSTVRHLACQGGAFPRSP